MQSSRIDQNERSSARIAQSEERAAKAYQTNPLNLDHKVAQIENAMEAIVTISDDETSMLDLKRKHKGSQRKLKKAVKTMNFKKTNRQQDLRIVELRDQYDRAHDRPGNKLPL